MPTAEANCSLVILELSSINSIIRKAVLPSFLPSKLFTGYFCRVLSPFTGYFSVFTGYFCRVLSSFIGYFSEFTPTFSVLVPCKFGALSPYCFLFRAASSSKEKRLIHGRFNSKMQLRSYSFIKALLRFFSPLVQIFASLCAKKMHQQSVIFRSVPLIIWGFSVSVYFEPTPPAPVLALFQAKEPYSRF